ncbi:hypothetical protein RDWZM_003419 [Blomia tropicalis]|uniref:Sorting nexin-14 n=1 Tax=Blomia tropicalis TaxID=40697 RepID=A0A9Q0RSI3_BLOTA|nr:hypothetical protein RDWZM_003419 [Blomia tropicalis]
MRIDRQINQKLELLFDSLVEQHTKQWLPMISRNQEEIVIQLKQLIRIISASLLLRIYNRLNWNEFLLRKLPKLLLQHFEMYIHGKRKAKSARFLEESVLKEYGHLLHPGLIHSENEIKFLKSISNLLIHTSLPPKYIKCNVSQSFLNEFISCSILQPLATILTDPNKINSILIFLLEPSTISYENINSYIGNSTNDKVEYLQNYCILKQIAGKALKNQCHLGIDRKQIVTDQHLLFLFTQFAKEEYILNILQFVIHMDSFMERITNPELTDQQLRDLHSFLKTIFDQYLSDSSNDSIPFNQTIRKDFYEAVLRPYSTIKEFRNSKSLYEAYEYGNELLEHFCEKFFRTDVYLKLICGQRSFSFNLDHSEYEPTDQNHSKSIQDLPSSYSRIYESDNQIKDLSNWSVTISKVNVKLDEMGHDQFYFELEIDNIDGRHWSVERQFNEFYLLWYRLKEFHGEEPLDRVRPLPSRKPLSRSNKNLMESYRYELEQFVRDLLTTTDDYLRRSELLFNFLTSPQFNPNYHFAESNFNLGRMIKNVPSRFAKERGQHLYSYLKNFIGQCEKSTIVTEPNKVENVRKLSKNSFRAESDSIDLSTHEEDGATLNEKESKINCHLEYLYDYLLLVLIRLYKVNTNGWLLQLLFMIRPLFRQTFQGLTEWWLSKRLQTQLLTSNRICALIDDLYQSLNQSDESSIGASNSNLTKSQRSQKALLLAKQFIPQWMLDYVLDGIVHEQVVFHQFSLLQHRMLNKQLLYMMVNSIIEDLFPEAIYQTIET